MTEFSATLDVETKQINGYKRAIDKNGTPLNYWYRFWDDAGQSGDITTVSKSKDGDSTLLVKFDKKTKMNFEIADVLFYEDKTKKKLFHSGSDQQLDSSIDNDRRGVTIYDRIETYGGIVDYFYSVLVVDSAAQRQVIICDPTIHNIGVPP